MRIFVFFCLKVLFFKVNLTPPSPPLDSYSQRAAVRAALAKDPSWISEYISKALPMLTSQDNEVLYLVPWSHLQGPPQEGGKPRPHTVKTKELISMRSSVRHNTRCVFQVSMSWFPIRCVPVVRQFGARPSRVLCLPMMHLDTANCWELSTASLAS